MSEVSSRAEVRQQLRPRVVGGLTALLFAGLIAQLWYLQVVSSSTYDELAAGNRTRLVRLEAPRGRLLDARGRALADTRSALTVIVDQSSLGHLTSSGRARVFDQLAAELNHGGHESSSDDLAARYAEAAGRTVEPVVVASDIDIGTWIAIEERRLPGVTVEERPVRVYPYGSTAAHLIGHLGTVGDGAEADALNRAAGQDKRYRAGDVVGRQGLELMFEAELRGTPELRRVEIDAANRAVRTIEVVQAPVPGADVHLTIDLDLQQRAERSLEEQLLAARARPAAVAAPAGAIVAIDPGDGAVRALASYPTFDPAWFAGGLTPDQAEALFGDESQPLLNRAIAGRYPPGSTFKPVTAYTAQLTGARAAGEIWIDNGTHTVAGCDPSPGEGTGGRGCRFRNAGSVAMGPVDLPAALARSSDTYFYSLGEQFWVERARFGPTPIQDAARLFGLGQPTGIGLPGEDAGVVPTPDGRAADGRGWFTGDNVNLAIGQGDLLVTPIQLANLYAGLVSGGSRFQPRLVTAVTGVTTIDGRAPTVDIDPVPLAPPSLDQGALVPILHGLATAPRTGTAAAAFAGFPLDEVPIGGKTGTAQVTNRDDFALFVGYGPDPDPDLVVAVVLEEAGFGGRAAAPAARSVLGAGLGVVVEADGGPVVDPATGIGRDRAGGHRP